MEIEEHIALHRDNVRAMALEWANYNEDDADEAEQAILVLMWERHESGTYDHHRPSPYRPGEYVSLLGYIRPYIRGVAKQEINKYKHFERDEKDRPILVVMPHEDNYREQIPNFEDLQESALEQGRDRDYLERIGDEPMPGLKTPLEDTLSPEDYKLAAELAANLTDEELQVLDASVYRSIHRAAESLDMSYTTYYRRLRDARAKAKALASTLSLDPPMPEFLVGWCGRGARLAAVVGARWRRDRDGALPVRVDREDASRWPSMLG